MGLFTTLLTQPLFNFSIFIYEIIPDVGVAIIILTIIIKLALLPFTQKSMIAQEKLSKIQPEIEKIRVEFKDNKQKQAEETMKLYRDSKVNPFSSCLPLLLQIPVFLALFYILKNSLQSADFSMLYSFIKKPENFNTISFGFIDLGKKDYVLAILAALSQWYQAKMMFHGKLPNSDKKEADDENFSAILNKQMLYVLPALTFIASISLPSGLALYWLISTIITIAQQFYIKKKLKNPDEIIEGKLIS